MELEMETNSSTAKPDPSEEDENSPLMEVNSSSAEIVPQTETTSDAIRPASSEGCFFKWCCSFILSVLFCSSIFIFTLPFIIKIPDYTPTFQVDSISISSLNVSSYQISGNWNINFTVKNPKGGGQPMYYYAIRVIIFYQNEYLLSIGNVESFYLRNGEERSVQANLGGSSENVEKWVVSAIESDMHTRREMNIFVELEAFVIYNPGMEKFRRKQSVRVSCNDLKVQLFSDNVTAGSMSSGNTVKCGLKFEVEDGV